MHFERYFFGKNIKSSHFILSMNRDRTMLLSLISISHINFKLYTFHTNVCRRRCNLYSNRSALMIIH